MKLFILVLIVVTVNTSCICQSRALVFQSDFGLKDGAVAAMKGVAYSVDRELQLFDITHEIPAFNIWEAAYRLKQAASYWPSGTVFVSVVDPGVGSDRKSVVVRTRSGHYFVTPDNGTLTLIADELGIEQVREIDEAKNRLKNSDQSYTFHGRDVYAYTGARLAAGIVSFEQIGQVLATQLVRLHYQKPTIDANKITGTIDILDIQYGNIWTNIDKKAIDDLKLSYGDRINVKIYNKGELVYDAGITFGKTFADVPEGKPVGYLNSLLNFSVGINRGNFAQRFNVGSGPDWKIAISR